MNDGALLAESELTIAPLSAAGVRTDAMSFRANLLFATAWYALNRACWNQALNAWSQSWGSPDEALAMDGKTMKNALDQAGHQSHIMSVIGHDSKRCYAQKKSARCRSQAVVSKSAPTK